MASMLSEVAAFTLQVMHHAAVISTKTGSLEARAVFRVSGVQFWWVACFEVTGTFGIDLGRMKSRPSAARSGRAMASLLLVILVIQRVRMMRIAPVSM